MRKIGDLGERAAERALKKRGYRIVERNYASQYGEIDLIARDGAYLCFVEVRLRRTTDFGTPAETVNRQKQRRIAKTAMHYVQTHHLEDQAMRFDVVSVVAETAQSRLRNPTIEVIENAFSLSDLGCAL